MKTALVVGLVVAVYAPSVVVTLALSVFVVTNLALSAFGPVFGPVLLASFAEYWGVGALFFHNFALLFWSFVLATGLVLAAVIVVVWRIIHGSSRYASKCNG